MRLTQTAPGWAAEGGYAEEGGNTEHHALATRYHTRCAHAASVMALLRAARAGVLARVEVRCLRRLANALAAENARLRAALAALEEQAAAARAWEAEAHRTARHLHDALRREAGLRGQVADLERALAARPAPAPAEDAA